MKDPKEVLTEKLSPLPSEIRLAILECLSGLSVSEAVEQVDPLISVYYQTKLRQHIKKAEPIGGIIEGKHDYWPQKVDEKAILDKKFKDAFN